MNQATIDTYVIFLENKGYSQLTCQYYSKALSHAPDIWSQCTTAELYKHITDYLSNKDISLGETFSHNFRPASIQFFQMKAGISFRDYEQQYKFQKSTYADLVTDFYMYSVEFKHMTAMAAQAEVSHVSRFLDSLDARPEKWTTLDAKFVSNYICTAYNNIKPSSMGRYITSIRNFFRFLEYKGYPVHSSVLTLPLGTADWAKSKVPVTLSPEEEHRLRNHYTPESNNYIRNNIIIRLMLDLGLRCAEVAALTLEDIKWSQGVITVHNTKNKCVREIPLSVELGKLLEEYVMFYRSPDTTNIYLFLRKELNHYTRMSRECIRGVVRRAFEAENIQGWWKGTHALRRTAASKIYNNGNDLKIVADILGHESIDSTKAYVRVDFQQLRMVAFPWPGGDNNG